MSMEQGIKHGKEHRKPYYRSGKYDRTCRPHGGCPYCKRNREHAAKIREEAAIAQEDDA